MKEHTVRLTIEEVENGFVVSETVVERETQGSRTYGEEIHVFHSVKSMVKFFTKRFKRGIQGDKGN